MSFLKSNNNPTKKKAWHTLNPAENVHKMWDYQLLIMRLATLVKTTSYRRQCLTQIRRCSNVMYLYGSCVSRASTCYRFPRYWTGLVDIVACVQQRHKAACASATLLFYFRMNYSINCYKYYSLTCYTVNSEIFARVRFYGSSVKIKPLGNGEITMSLNHV